MAALGMIEIPLEEYHDLKDNERFMLALEGAGVDNWDGYGYALYLYHDGEEQ